MTTTDPHFMDRALALAALAHGQTSPNPLVGAVVVRGETPLGEAFHRRAGLPHAEPQALELARASTEAIVASKRDWTLYVNLEPCAHHGRTPPCVEAIIGAPVERVVAALLDPDPRTAGKGAARLRAAGVQVDVGCRKQQAAELNHVFVARQLRGRPYVALKVALSADGCSGAAGGGPAPITGPEARRHTHRLRAGLDAILVGVETLRRDRPRLDTRLHEGPASTPRRIVVDPDLRSEPEWLWPGEARPVLFCSQSARDARGARLDRSADLVALPDGERGLDLQALPEALAALDLWSVLVEGGGRTHRAFLAAGIWDRMYVYRNPGLVLRGLSWAAAEAWERASDGLRPWREEALGADRLEVFAHPATLLAGA